RRRASEPVADERERDERAERRGDERGEERDLEADRNGTAEPRVRERVLPVLEREPFPRVVEAALGVVEREDDHDRDRQEEVRKREERVGVEHVTADPGDHAAVPAVSRSVPSRRAKISTSTRIAPMRMNDRAAAVG